MTPSFIYRIKEIKNHEKGLNVHLHLPAEFFTEEFLPLELNTKNSFAEVQGQLQFLPLEQIEFRGGLKAHFDLSCQRCLEPTQIFVENPCYILFLPHEGETVEKEGRSDEAFDPEEADVVYHNHEYIDMAPILREQILLMLPMTVLCEENCLGLCPICGENRNIVACTCKPDVSFSPFAVLKNLSEKMDR